MLATAARFHDLHMSDVRVEKYAKYTREHYSAVFDNLHTKKEFYGRIKRTDFPLRPTGSSLRSYHGLIDLNADSDGSVDEGLFGNSSDESPGESAGSVYDVDELGISEEAGNDEAGNDEAE